MILAEAPCPISTTGGCSCRGLIGPRRSMHSVTVDVGVVIIARGGSIGSALMMRFPRNARCWCYDEHKGGSKPERAKFHFDCSARIQAIGAIKNSTTGSRFWPLFRSSSAQSPRDF